jgi:hypothetical protein
LKGALRECKKSKFDPNKLLRVWAIMNDEGIICWGKGSRHGWSNKRILVITSNKSRRGILHWTEQ